MTKQTQFERFIASLTGSVWFTRLGSESDNNTVQLAQGYLHSVDRDHVQTKFVTDWNEARRAARNVEWDRALFSRQGTERRNLQRQADEKHKQTVCRARLEEAVKAISAATDVALETAQSTRPGDESIAKAAVGALSEAAFEAALTTLAEAEFQHPARLKFALFRAGRWPLTVTRRQFFYFDLLPRLKQLP